MVEIESWMNELAEQLTRTFGARLLFLGLQGSYGRGEATEQSDIDVVTVLDTVHRTDLDTYRTVVRALPEGDKTCGFICGRRELRSWPKYDLLQLAEDTRPWYGALEDLLPGFTRHDLAEAVQNGAANLYHATCHTYLYADRDAWPAFLREAQKGAFFVLRDWYELRTGCSVRGRKELLPLLEGDAREILACGLDGESEPGAAFERLLRWSGTLLEQMGDLGTEIP